MDALPGDPMLLACLEAAIAAPSVQNTQPWSFQVRAGLVAVFANRERHLGGLDPRGRNLTISIGTALLNLRLAILNQGRVPRTELLPDPAQPDLMARVAIDGTAEPDPTVRRLYEAIPRRRTNRRPFTGRRVGEEILGQLAAAARAEGARLAVLDDIQRRVVLHVVQAAEQRLRADAALRAELRAATTGSAHGDQAGPPDAEDGWGAMEFLPVAHLDVLAAFDPYGPPEPGPPGAAGSDPTLVLLSAPADTPEQWLRAGQAMERVLLTATVHGVCAVPMTQPFEVPEMRALLTDPDEGGYPQMILRIGYGSTTPAAAPRRPLAELLIGAGS
jgi:nitroreductase